LIKFLNKTKTRQIPYPPNFNKTPARIIDPATGASTWALGNHRWPIKTGIFTKKANTKKNLKPPKETPQKDRTLFKLKSNLTILKLPKMTNTIKITINNGKEAVKV